MRITFPGTPGVKGTPGVITVNIIPDMVDGGFTVQCVEEPAAISQGETLREALDNIFDALKLILCTKKGKMV